MMTRQWDSSTASRGSSLLDSWHAPENVRQTSVLSLAMTVIPSSGVRQTEVCRTSFNFHLGQLLVLLPTVMHSLLYRSNPVTVSLDHPSRAETGSYFPELVSGCVGKAASGPSQPPTFVGACLWPYQCHGQ